MRTIEQLRSLLNDRPPQVGSTDLTPHGAAADALAAGACGALQDDDPLGFTCTLDGAHSGNWHVAGDGQQVLAVWGTLL